MRLALELLLLPFVGTALFFYLWSAFCTWDFFKGKSFKGKVFRGTSPALPTKTPQPPASILVPVCGVEEDARRTWQALCEQDYGDYEVLFGVKDPQDPAIPILKALEEQFPGRARYVPCPETRGVNFKVSNLMQLREVAQHDLIVFADSDIQVGSDYLETVLAPLVNPGHQPPISLVTCAYVSRHPQTLGAVLASLGRCVDFIPSVLVARRMDGGLGFALGATVATRQSVLNQIPDLPTLANRIGDDYHIGNMTARAGFRVELSEYVVEINITTESLEQVYARELRWSRTIRNNRGPQYLGLGVVYGTIYSLLLLVASGFQPWAFWLCLVTYAVRGLQVVVALNSLNCQSLLPWFWTLPLRDSMSFLTWFQGVTGNKVRWRGRILRVSPGGFIQEAEG
jgi:ceramide glucosyltransferase